MGLRLVRLFAAGAPLAGFDVADFPRPVRDVAGLPLLDLECVFFPAEGFAGEAFLLAGVFCALEAAERFLPASFFSTTLDSFSED